MKDFRFFLTGWLCLAILSLSDSAFAQNYGLKQESQDFLKSPSDTASVAFTLEKSSKDAAYIYSCYGNETWASARKNGVIGFVRVADLEVWCAPKRRSGQVFGAYEVLADSLLATSDPDGGTIVLRKGDILPINKAYMNEPRFVLVTNIVHPVQQNAKLDVSVSVWGDAVRQVVETGHMEPVLMKDGKVALRETQAPYSNGAYELLFTRLRDTMKADYEKVAPRTLPVWVIWAGVIVVFFGMRFVCRKVRIGLLQSKSLSNDGLFWLLFVGTWLLMWQLVNLLWIRLDGLGAFLALIGCLCYGVLVCMRNKGMLAFRCPGCHTYPAQIRLLSRYKGEIEECHSEEEGDYDGNTQQTEHSLETEHIYYRKYITEYWQIYYDHNRCEECGHEWKVRYRGQYLGRDVETRKKKVRERASW